jgi:hypothetical protein
MHNSKRREFIMLLGSTAVAWPFAGRAQQSALGFLSSRSADDSIRVVAAFRQGLAEKVYAEGSNWDAHLGRVRRAQQGWRTVGPPRQRRYRISYD